MNLYTPHPKHIPVAFLFILTGYVVMLRDGWITFGLITIILGILTWIVILIAMAVTSYANYYQEIAGFLAMVDRIKNPDVRDAMLAFFGFPTNPKTLRVIEELTDNGEQYPEIKYHDLPIPVHVMRYIADNVLTGHSFSEKQLAGRGKPISSNKFREYQKLFLDSGLAKPNNARAKNLGISLTHKGQKIMLECCSESVKRLVRDGG